MKRNVVTAFLSIAGGRFGIIVVSTLVTPLLVRYLTQGQYGAYGVVMAVFGMLMILVSSGINSGVRKFLAEDRDDDDWASSVFGFYFRVAFGLAIVPAVIFAVAAYTGLIAELDMFGPSWKPYFYLLAVLTLAAQFREYVRRALMGLELEHVSEPIKVLHKAAFGVVAVVLAYLGHGVIGVLVGEIVASGLAFLVAFYFISSRVSLSGIFRPLPDDFPKRELFSFNYLTIVYIFLLTSMYHVDVLMVNDILNSQTAGVYKGALVIVEFLWLVPRSVQSVLIQSTSGLWADDNLRKVNDMASKATRYTLLFTLLLAIGLAALATEFVPLYLGEDYSDAVLPLLLLLPGTLGFAIARPIFAISHAKGELKVVIAATGAAAIINLVLNALLIPRFGMLGAAVATSIGYGSLPFFHYFGARHIGYAPFADARLPRIALTGLLAGIPIVLLALAIDDRILALVIVPVIGGVLYGVFTLLTGAIDVEEVLSVLVALPGPIGPRARSFRRRIRRSPDPLTPFAANRTRKLLTRVLLVVGLIALVAGVAVAVGLDDPRFGLSSPNVTSTATATPVPDDGGVVAATQSPTSTRTPTPDGKDTPTASDTPPPSPTPTPSESSTPSATGTPAPSPTDDGTSPPVDGTPTIPDTPSPPGGGETPTPTDADTPTPTPADTPTSTPTSTPTPSENSAPADTPSSTPTPTDTPTPTPTATPSPTPTPTPTPSTQASMFAGLWGLLRSWSVGWTLAVTGAGTALVVRRA